MLSPQKILLALLHPYTLHVWYLYIFMGLFELLWICVLGPIYVSYFLAVPFKRIHDDLEIKNDRLRDQSYYTKNGDRFAARAADDLIKVRGKDFRKEMQKKKRSSWNGAGERLVIQISIIGNIC